MCIIVFAMIDDMFYLSEEGNLERAVEVTGLASDEIEHMVGRFAAHSRRAGRLHGKVLIYVDGTVELRHDFKNTLYWRSK